LLRDDCCSWAMCRRSKLRKPSDMGSALVEGARRAAEFPAQMKNHFSKSKFDSG
jgi:hypothetical protein